MVISSCQSDLTPRATNGKGLLRETEMCVQHLTARKSPEAGIKPRAFLLQAQVLSLFLVGHWGPLPLTKACPELQSAQPGRRL